MKSKFDRLEFFKSIYEYTRKYGTMVHMKIGPVGHVLLASDYKFLEFLLTNNNIMAKSTDMKFLEPWVGKGLATVSGNS
jgi:hypothetical protein